MIDHSEKIQIRTLELVSYEGQILTLDEYLRMLTVKLLEEDMDKEIRKVEKGVKKTGKELKKLEKMDIKQDKKLAKLGIGEKAAKKKKK